MSNSPESHTSRVVNLIETHQLSQLINQPTRVTEETRTLIDLFITNSEESILHSGVYPLSISDHNLIYAVRKISIPRSSPRYIETRSFKNFKTEEFKSDLRDANWPHIHSMNNANEAWESWKKYFLEYL